MPSARKPRRSGANESTPGGKDSTVEILWPSPELRKLLEKVFASCREGLRAEVGPTEYKRRKAEFVFHMTDWLNDLKDINELYEHPGEADLHGARVRIIGMLCHVVPHLNAAGWLLLDKISDPFAGDAALAENAEPGKAEGRPAKPRSRTAPPRQGRRVG